MAVSEYKAPLNMNYKKNIQTTDLLSTPNRVLAAT